MDLRIAHVVRDHGGLTEPFIQHRLLASTAVPAAELWTERSVGPSPLVIRNIRLAGLSPGSPLDRVFHRIPWIGPPLAGAYAQAARAFEPSVVHAHYATTGYLVGAASRAPLIVNTYGFDVTVLARQRAWRAAYRALVRRLPVVVVEGPAMAARVIRLGFPADRVVVIPISAGLEKIDFGPHASDGPLRLVACGRMVEKKGHDLAILAFSAAARGLPAGSELRIIGDGPLRSRLQGLAARSARAGQIRFLGSLPRPRYLDELRRADLFLAPSRTASNGDGEGGAPTTILDAQAVGIPVVASDHADIPFLIQDGETGFLAREGDLPSLVAAIDRAIRATPDRPEMVRHTRARMLARNGDAAVGRQLLELYERVAAAAR